MAISSAHSNFFLYPSKPSISRSLFFHEFEHRSYSLKICCNQTVLLDDDETQSNTNLVKKKRKPRPSFLDQVQNKWSVKNPDLVENFPWQEQKIGDTNQELQPPVGSSENESEKISNSVSDAVSYRTLNKSNLAPWVHGTPSRKEVLNPRNSPESVRRNDEGLDGFRNEDSFVNFTEGSEDLVKDGRSERECDEYDKIENLGSQELKSIVSVEDSSTDYGNVGSTRSAAADTNDLERLPWDKKGDKNENLRNRRRLSAEKLIPEHELRRLRSISLRLVERIKVGSSGVTQALVDAIHEKWKDEEVVKLKFEGTPSKNMQRMHEFLESRTRGLVIWRSGSSVVLYRGSTYKLDCVKSYSKRDGVVGALGSSSPTTINAKCVDSSRLVYSSYFKNLSEKEQMSLSELDVLLDELGPRFTDWMGREPVPVDADLLPAVVPGYKTPFRLLPHGIRQTLRDQEMTYLRKIARTLPPHFALGRNRALQGLASAIVKLWEKSLIAKVVIKRGVQNTCNERMAEELKILTGGTLLSRNKEFIVLYRGNDFLPPRVTSALVQAEKRATLQQDDEEQARYRAAALIGSKSVETKQQLVAGTLAETVAATSCWRDQPSSSEVEKMRRDEAVARHTSLINSLQRKLALAMGKMRESGKTLKKVLQNQEPEKPPTDLETLTDEERFLFRRIGLSMKSYLLLGRREVFDGTIENMHLHWKYREVVKIMVQRKHSAQVKHIALSLEAESGGVLVSVEKTTKGHAIILYRGKNYQPPLAFRPKHLLTKRQALARSIELQRRQALKHHIVELEEKIERLKEELDEKMSNGDGDI